MTDSNDIVEMVVSTIVILLFLPIFSRLLAVTANTPVIGTETVMDIVLILLYLLIGVILVSALFNGFEQW